MSDLRIGVIGSGGRGGLASHAHSPESGSRVVACCDVSPAVLERNRAKYGEELFTTADYRQLLDRELDAVFVCTPDFLHEEHAVACLEAGLPVYLEKPMAISIEGCDRILGTARARGVKLFVGHNMRYMTIIRKMRALIDKGAIGEVRSVWCRHFISYGGVRGGSLPGHPVTARWRAAVRCASLAALVVRWLQDRERKMT